MRIDHGLHGLGSLTLAVIWMLVCGGAALAATGTSAEFKIDLKGMGPWDMHTAAASEAIAYSSAWATNALSGAAAVVKVYPVKCEKPKYIAINLSGGKAASHYPIEYLDDVPDGGWTDEYKTTKLVLRHIPAGSFIMGGRATDYPGAANTNLHMVTLTKDFYIGVFEVTQRQWELVMGNRPSYFTNNLYYAKRPIERVSYVDIRGANTGLDWPISIACDVDSFMGRLRSKSRLVTCDLPTEAQWEYSCRAGTTSALNIGVDLSALTNCPNATSVARYYANGTIHNVTDDSYRNYGVHGGTAPVGTYLPNAWGLYDMHGNVFEVCIDKQVSVPSGDVDPVGNGDSELPYCQVRGGSWQEPAVGIISGNHRVLNGVGHDISSRINHVGFRLCLQGGEIPETTEGMELVNAAGTGDATWTPTKTGTYYLTHETQTNGVNGAELLGAWFTVGGPKLTFTPDGELTPGVRVAIGGAGEGWHVYYTLDGSAPTQSSASEYTAPITLDDSTTIRAIAFSDGGMESEEFSASFSLMSVANAVAKPRYPWNGKVDIDCEVKGDTNLEYLVSLEALDLDGGTNLPVRTVVGRAAPSAPQSQANEFDFGGRGATALPPGTYRFTWDADADIAGDGDFPNVAVSVKAEGSATVGAKRVVTLTVDGYAGTEVLTNVPTLVRLSTSIEGFNYADFADANGGDLIFCDESESVIYPHEIDEWHVGGESLVWVKMPVMTNGVSFKMAYGNSQLATHNSQLYEHAVWSDYAGVWHMNEDSGTAYDSTARGLDALPSCGANGTSATMAQMVAYANGACGRARVNGLANGKAYNNMLVPASPAFCFGGKFTVSGWFNANGMNAGDDPRLISQKNAFAQKEGFELNFENSLDALLVRGQTNVYFIAQVPSISAGWVDISVVFDSTNAWLYANGTFVTNGIVEAVIDNPGGMLAFGGNNAGNTWSLNGQYDEIRLSGGALSADRIKADYDMIKNKDFLIYSAAVSGKGVAE